MTAPPISCDARPRRVSDVEVCRRVDDETIILRRRGRYATVSPRGLEIWQSFDGAVDMRELSNRYPGTGGADTTAAIVALTRTLADCGFVTLDAPTPPAPSGRNRPAGSQASRTLLEGYLTFSPPQAIETSYRVVSRACNPTIVAGAGLLAAVGFLVFLFLLTQQRTFLEPSTASLVALGLATCVSACAHEAAHALTLRHFGGFVSRAGIGWYWFAPTAFVDTSDAYLLSRGQRIAVCLAGPAVDAVVAGAAALGAAFATDPGVAAWGLTLASLTYMRILWNFNPLLETDWYYALTDVLGRPNLRRDGFAQLLGGQPLRDRVGLVYGTAALLYAVVYVVFAVPALIRATFGIWLAPIAPAAVVAVLPIAGAIVAAASIGATIHHERSAR